VEKFNGKLAITPTAAFAIPKWVWFIIGGLIVLILLLLVLYFRRRRQPIEEEMLDSFANAAKEQREARIPPISDGSPEAIKKKQLENMARENPQDFVKLLRTWISED
jgi:flagellar M-ring protein FliF